MISDELRWLSSITWCWCIEQYCWFHSMRFLHMKHGIRLMSLLNTFCWFLWIHFLDDRFYHISLSDFFCLFRSFDYRIRNKIKQVLHIFSKLISMSWMCFLCKAQHILLNLVLQRYRFKKLLWFETLFNWLLFAFSCFVRYKVDFCDWLFFYHNIIIRIWFSLSNLFQQNIHFLEITQKNRHLKKKKNSLLNCSFIEIRNFRFSFYISHKYCNSSNLWTSLFSFLFSSSRFRILASFVLIDCFNFLFSCFKILFSCVFLYRLSNILSIAFIVVFSYL